MWIVGMFQTGWPDLGSGDIYTEAGPGSSTLLTTVTWQDYSTKHQDHQTLNSGNIDTAVLQYSLHVTVKHSQNGLKGRNCPYCQETEDFLHCLL